MTYLAAFCGKTEDLPGYCKVPGVYLHLLLKKWRLFLILSCASWNSTNTSPWAFCCVAGSPWPQLVTSIFLMSRAACKAALRHSINICQVNELTFLKGQSCKRGSSLKVYNLENINYVEMVCVIVWKGIPKKQNNIFSGCMSGCRIVFPLVFIHSKEVMYS